MTERVTFLRLDYFPLQTHCGLLMPYSEIAYYDIGLSDFLERENSEDRVEYEDHRLQSARLFSGPKARSEEPFKTELQGVPDTPSEPAASTLRITLQQFFTHMEGIQNYSGVGGGVTRKTFKQGAKVVYQKMLRDHREHQLARFG